MRPDSVGENCDLSASSVGLWVRRSLEQATEHAEPSGEVWLRVKQQVQTLAPSACCRPVPKSRTGLNSPLAHAVIVALLLWTARNAGSGSFPWAVTMPGYPVATTAQVGSVADVGAGVDQIWKDPWMRPRALPQIDESRSPPPGDARPGAFQFPGDDDILREMARWKAVRRSS